ncbi:hypothetical protein ACS0TY_002760 [Phlomoides rotata]
MSPAYFRQLNLIVFVMGLSSTHMVWSQSLVEYLPGFPGKLPFKLETGYIGVGESEDLQMFYYFVESERSPDTDPLLIWIQGGPGCSGFTGLAYIMGPLMFDYTDTNSTIPSLVLNPYSWTKVSNIIFIDQPVGTGFTYPKTPGAYESNDTISGYLAYEFLQKWIINHPKFQKNPLYVAGDSFGGIIVPLVVDHVYDGIKAGSEPHLNMKGYILGNPITDYFVDYNGRIPYAHRMGLLSDELYLSAKESCNGNYVSVDPSNHLCKNVLERLNQCVEKIFILDISEPWCALLSGKGVLLSHHMPPEDEINARRFLQSSAPLRAKSWCRAMNYLFSLKWANIKLVQEALHVREGTIIEWVRCNRTLPIESYTNDVDSTIKYHKKFVDQTDCKALIYSGDHDLGAPHSGTEEWIRSLKLQIKSDWRPWFVEGQIAGYTSAYFNNKSELTYATVKGAGHTAPEFKPLECLFLIDRWLSRKPL